MNYIKLINCKSVIKNRFAINTKIYAIKIK